MVKNQFFEFVSTAYLFSLRIFLIRLNTYRKMHGIRKKRSTSNCALTFFKLANSCFS